MEQRFLKSDATVGGGDTGRVGYVLKVFPRVSETFVINEVLALESFEQPVSVFSLHHPAESVAHGILDRLQAPVHYVEDVEADEDYVAAARRWLTRRLEVDRRKRDLYLPRKYVRLALGLARLGLASRVEHFHAHFASRSGHVALLAANLAGISYSITAHAKDIYHSDVDLDVLRWKIRHAKFVATVTDYNLRYLKAVLGDDYETAKKVIRIYNGVELSRVHSDLPASSGPPLLLGIGRLVEKKGFDVLIDACRILRDAGSTFRCEIVGGGDLECVLSRQIANLDLSDVVTLRGSLTTEQVALRLREAAVVTLPCVVGGDGNVDALPTVLLEAMAAGRALVSTRVSGVPEIVEHECNGLLVEPGDASSLASALAALPAHPERAAEMGRHGRRLAAEKFDLYKNASGVRDLMLADSPPATGVAGG